MDKKLFNDYIELATKAAIEAGNFLKNSKNDINVINKSEGRDIKLVADIEAERIIRKILNSSNIPILGEELGLDSAKLDDTIWVVDPLDGTANYNRNIPISCVSIALLKELNPILGVIYDFNNDLVYSGGTQKKATENSSPIYVSKLENKKEGTMLTGLPVNTDYSSKAIKSLIDNFKSWKKVRMIGSAAIASIYVASGRADYYSESGTNIWDIAAGVAITRAAGGKAEIKNLSNNFSLDIVITNGLL